MARRWNTRESEQWRLLAPYRSTVAAMALLLVLATVLAVLSPQILRGFIDAIGERDAALATKAAAFLAVAVGAELLWLAADYLGARVAWSATNELRARLAEHCLRQDLPFFEKHSGGVLIDRIDGDVGKLANYFSQLLLLVASNALLVLGIGVALAVQDWRIGLCYAPFVAGSVVLLRRLFGAAVPAAVAQREASAALLGYLEERLHGLVDIQANGASGALLQGFWLRAAGLLSAARRSARLAVRWPAAAQGLAALSLLLALVAGAVLVGAGELTVGGAYALTAYAGMLQMPLMVIVSQMRDLEDAVGALHRVRELLRGRPTVGDGERELRMSPQDRLGVALVDVSFSYRPGEFALRKLSVEFRAGRTVAVVGRTGSGKSTLARLLCRFADPAAGAVRVGPYDARELTLASLRRHVAYLPQDVRVLHASVRDNVTLFDDGRGDDQVAGALAAVGLGRWLAGLPDGLATPLMAGGAGLSAGEAQLLAFARAILADPHVLILDETTSRLDPAARETVLRTLRRVCHGRTSVIIAHQPEVLAVADDVLVLRDGEAVEFGPCAELRADPASALSQAFAAGRALV